MKKLLIGIVIGIALSNVSGLYAGIKFEYWLNSHGSNIGMPVTWDIQLAEFLRSPVEKFLENFGD